ncbi:hypothetical protein PC116_g21533 [Phytophthora cactorum]|uniref:Uncharacterized protein n=1 Tax=Phytophthora cactorum TaxID=29920 RepID=A0A329RGH9_9STRA|nr:hypothetical protein Pcac1_g4859 [Phytophthora cactorum]KAG2811558.1 hypothetical protein PC111_g15185 [Phytophthora cactorum]KAG2886967.1 hypothetical protein PC114_g19008 [Phytophthora cactorum]KAG2913805.1 hypothetical protein PC117_g18499 [Phytophthora cactorum]KAG3005566.1 hypothetical protein PC120_g17897 [Phytophthora cactorum]
MSLFRQKLKMDLSIDNCGARVFRYYEDFNGIIEDNGLQGLLGTDNASNSGYKSRMKARCRLLVEILQPPVLKSQITRLIDLERRECKRRSLRFVQQRFHRLSKAYATKSLDRKFQRMREQGQQRPPSNHQWLFRRLVGLQRCHRPQTPRGVAVQLVRPEHHLRKDA